MNDMDEPDFKLAPRDTDAGGLSKEINDVPVAP